MQDAARYWNVTPEERRASYPCDAHAERPFDPVLRAIDVGAAPALVFRWLCQFKVAPYSYDLLDNWGRRSPRELTPGLERLEVGQRFLVFDLVEFEPGVHLTGVAHPVARRLFGPLTITYLVVPRGSAGSRMVVKMCLGVRGRADRVRAVLLEWGDLVMMRKQLMTVRDLAEASAASA